MAFGGQVAVTKVGTHKCTLQRGAQAQRGAVSSRRVVHRSHADGGAVAIDEAAAIAADDEQRVDAGVVRRRLVAQRRERGIQGRLTAAQRQRGAAVGASRDAGAARQRHQQSTLLHAQRAGGEPVLRRARAFVAVSDRQTGQRGERVFQHRKTVGHRVLRRPIDEAGCFVSADVGRACAHHAPLVGGRRRCAVGRVQCGAAGQQRVCGGQPAVVQQRSQQRVQLGDSGAPDVACGQQAGAAVAVEVVAQRVDGVVGVVARRVEQQRVLQLCVGGALQVDARRAAARHVVGNGRVQRRQVAVVVDTTAQTRGTVAAQGAVDQGQAGATASAVDGAPIVATGVAAEGAAHQRDRAAVVVDAAAPVAGRVVADGAVVGRHHTLVVVDGCARTGLVGRHHHAGQGQAGASGHVCCGPVLVARHQAAAQRQAAQCHVGAAVQVEQAVERLAVDHAGGCARAGDGQRGRDVEVAVGVVVAGSHGRDADAVAAAAQRDGGGAGAVVVGRTDGFTQRNQAVCARVHHQRLGRTGVAVQHVGGRRHRQQVCNVGHGDGEGLFVGQPTVTGAHPDRVDVVGVAVSRGFKVGCADEGQRARARVDVEPRRVGATADAVGDGLSGQVGVAGHHGGHGGAVFGHIQAGAGASTVGHDRRRHVAAGVGDHQSGRIGALCAVVGDAADARVGAAQHQALVCKRALCPALHQGGHVPLVNAGGCAVQRGLDGAAVVAAGSGPVAACQAFVPARSTRSAAGRALCPRAGEPVQVEVQRAAVLACVHQQRGAADHRAAGNGRDVELQQHAAVA